MSTTSITGFPCVNSAKTLTFKKKHFKKRNDSFHFQPPIKETWWKHLVAGGVSGIISRGITAPFDRLKVVAQVSGRSIKLVQGMVQLIKSDGPFALWRGNGINTMKTVPETATRFLSYESVKVLMMGGEHKKLPTSQRLIAACIAGATCQTAVHPLEVLKNRMVIHHGGKALILRAAYKSIVCNLGFMGLFRGYASCLGSMVLYTGADLTVYETCKLYAIEHLKANEHIPTSLMILCAIPASLIAQAVSFPLSLASTVLQVNDDWDMTAMKIMKERYSQHGTSGLFKGASLSYIKTVPAVVVTYWVYEHVLWKLGATMTL